MYISKKKHFECKVVTETSVITSQSYHSVITISLILGYMEV